MDRRTPAPRSPAPRDGNRAGESMPRAFLRSPRTELVEAPRDIRRGVLKIATILLLIIVGAYSTHAFLFGTPGIKKSRSATTSAAASISPENLKSQEQVAIGRSEVRTSLDQGDALRTACDNLDAELKRWSTDVEPLLSNDTGRLIASDTGAMLAFDGQTKQPRPTQRDIDALRSRLATLLTPVQAAWDAEQWSYRPSADLTAAMQQLKTDIDAALERAQSPRVRIAMIVTSAKLRGKSADMTLAAALEEHRAQQDAAWAASEATARQKVETEYAPKRSAQAEQSERAKQQAALDLDQEKADLDRAKLTTKTEKAKADADRKRLVRKAQSTETQSLLSFFMTPGYFQPNGSTTIDKHPYSFALLKADGSLDPTIDGQTRLFGHMYDGRDRDRPLVQNNNLALSNQPALVRERVNQIQKALIELGPTLVELKMLAP